MMDRPCQIHDRAPETT